MEIKYAQNATKQQYYLKDKKINLFKQKTSYVPGQGTTTVYQYINSTPLWAYTKQLSQNQIYAAHMYGENETRLFVLNYRNDLKVYDYIEYQDKYYSITRLDTTDDYNDELFIYVKDSKLPSGTTILPAAQA